MSPEVIVCDEIGAPEDLKALGFAANSGAALVCTCHSPTLADLKRRPAAGELIERGIFGTAAVLGTGAAAGKVIGFYEL
jgi:stage III sporulation protein AA